MRATALATAVALLLAGPAWAQGPISTTPAAGPAAPQPTTASPPLPSTGADSDPAPAQQQIAMGPCGPEKVKPDGSLETKPHGEVEVGVGTGGYRHVAGYVCQPIGQDGAVTVGVSQTQGDQGYRRR
jgi:hypothetical protein